MGNSPAETSTEYIVCPGDSVTKIAFAKGLFPETIWNHPDNAELKELRKSPDILLRGDVLRIPAKRVREEAADTEVRHTFRRKGVPAKTRLQICADGELQSNVAFSLIIRGRKTTLQADSQGVVEWFIPPNATRGELKDPKGRSWMIEFGELDPITEIVGVAKRLNNLGIHCEVAKEMNESIAAALREFQARAKLDVHGKLDGATLTALEKHHDSSSDEALPLNAKAEVSS